MPKHYPTIVAWLVTLACTSAIAAAPELKQLTNIKPVINDPQWVIIDIRPSDAFNGWPMKLVQPSVDQAEKAHERGGHIPSSTNFPADWIDQKNFNPKLADVDWKKIKLTSWQRFCKSNNIANKQVVLYDVGTKNEAIARKVAETLASLARIKSFHYFDATTYFADPANGLAAYANYQSLVPAHVVKSILDRRPPDGFDADFPIKIVECSWGPASKSYAAGHLPTAIHVNTNSFEPPPTWKLGDAALLTEFAGQHGFHKDDCVIVSGRDTLAAHRLALVLRYIGVRDVRVLNGGDASWQRAGFALEKTRHAAVPNDDFGWKIPARPELIDTHTEVVAGLKTPQQFTLVDNRTWEEHTGKVTGYSYHNVAGRIPGAIYGYAGVSGSNSMDFYRNQDDTMRPADQILALWKRQSIDPARHLSFMCGGGWRAAEVFHYASIIGLPDIAVYSDGWIRWSRDARNPTTTGEPSPIQP